MMKAKPVGATIEKVEARKAGSKTKYVATMTDGSELVLRTSGVHNYRFVGAYYNEGEKAGTALGDSYVDVSFHARRDLVKDFRHAIVIDGNSPAVDKLRKAPAKRIPQEMKQPKSMKMSDQAAFQVDHPWYRIPRNIDGRIQVVDQCCRLGLIVNFDVKTMTATVALDAGWTVGDVPLDQLEVQAGRDDYSSYRIYSVADALADRERNS